MLTICKKGFGRVIIARLAANNWRDNKYDFCNNANYSQGKAFYGIFWFFWCACLNILQNCVEAIMKFLVVVGSRTPKLRFLSQTSFLKRRRNELLCAGDVVDE